MILAKRFILAALLTLALFAGVATLAPDLSFAQTGLEEIQNETGLSDAPITVVIARLIRTALTFVGVVAVIIVLYGGFIWMTAGGRPEQVDKAKRILIGGLIGLVIILASYAIVTFVLSALLRATGSGGLGGGSGSGSGGGPPWLGGGTSAAFVVTNIRPQGNVPIRNVQVQVTFSRTIDAATAEGALVVRDTNGNQIDGTVDIRSSRMTFTPSAECPAPNQNRRCFDADTMYTVTVADTMRSTSGARLDCAAANCNASFMTGSLVDTADPLVTINLPLAGEVLAPFAITPIQANIVDDTQVSAADFAIGNEVIDSVPAAGTDLADVEIQTTWDNTNYQAGATYQIRVIGYDIAGNSDEAIVSVRIGPAHCYNGNIDVSDGETGIDCGGVCGVCGGASCTENNQCASGACIAGSCAPSSGIAGDPIARFISPAQGPVGQYITIHGSNLGARIGRVEFKNTSTGDVAIGSTAFPSVCSVQVWDPSQVTVIVPPSYLSGLAVEPTRHDVHVLRQDGKRSNSVDFQVTSGDPTPGICAITPANGEAGDAVVVHGDRFGASQAQSFFYNEVPAQVTAWNNNEVQLTVPSGGQTGPIYVKLANGIESNRMNFAYGEGDVVQSGGPRDAAYAWSFSTGRIPQTPQLIFACTDTQVSGVPNRDFSGNVCVAAQVYAEFSSLMDHSSLVEGSSILIEECNNDACRNGTVVDGDLVVTSSAERTAFSWTPGNYNGGVLRAQTIYRVTVTQDARSSTGIELGQNVSWQFTTGAEDAACEVNRVLVSPRSERLHEQGETTEFTALPITSNCVALNAQSFGWNWDINESMASIEEGLCTDTASDSCAVATALSEGTTLVTARESQSSVQGTANLEINFTDPYVAHFWPSNQCTTACVNADIGARFNIPMDISVEQAGMAVLFECTNELCLSYAAQVSTTASCLYSADGSYCKEISFNVGAPLKAGAFYRAIISRAVKSKSGIGLTRPNFGDDFSWIFATRTENIECTVSRIDLQPQSAVMSEIGARQGYTVNAYGSQDACSVAGQRLNAFSYGWNWQDPISDDEDVARWISSSGNAGLMDSAPGNLALGCTTSCLSTGSIAYHAVCGNNILEAGEECEDGNAQNGDGCSSMCLREGGAGNVGTCGDGVLDRLPVIAGFAGEDCDDGNLIDGDGCSAQCLNEGARAVGGTCGNGNVGYLPTLGGEDCDDGNRVSGDGCSSMCLNEGSPNALDIGAVCGNGVIESPYETCDDGNRVSGDGCSNICLREGANRLGFTCGDGNVQRNQITGAGEDCDGGDGCSARCTWLGSSIYYSTPSICGDGYAPQGSGENPVCEIGAAGDSLMDPIQVAEISTTAPSQVSTSTNRAEATIRVQASGLSLSDEASLALSCVARTDNDCSDPDRFGVADSRCCSLRPIGSALPGGENICQNASVYAVFNQEMDGESFDRNVFLELDTSTTGGVCPQGHTTLTADDIAFTPAKWLARALASLKSVFVGSLYAQSAGACVMPVNSVSQQRIADGEYRVNFHYRALLAPNARYTLIVRGDATINDAEKSGVMNTLGVAMNGTTGNSFTTSSTVCGLSGIEVIDTNRQSPNFFTQAGERHVYTGIPYSFTLGSRQDIEQIPGVYEWEWQGWREDSGGEIVEIENDIAGSAEVVAQRESGEADVVAQIRITTNAQGGTGEVITGTSKAYTFICENPWPNFDQFPFIDDATTTVPGAVQGVGWMNFSTYYCRDAGSSGVADDLPAASVVAPPSAESPGVIKEYLFRIADGSGDAIGMRIVANPEYLSPLAWYRAQGFGGSPSATRIDGFEAVQDGRTVYIAGPNLVPGAPVGQLYSNIYVVSYNEGASARTIEIFNQMRDNLALATNVVDTGLCTDGNTFTGDACSSDFDCRAGATCADQKAKLTRDVKRLADMKTVAESIAIYGAQNGRCSATSTQQCSTDAECPGTEVCQPSTPQLPAGTFVAGLDASPWGSWSNTLSTAIGSTLPTDPLNRYNGCGEGQLVGHDGETCVNQTIGVYACPVGSYAYHYRTRGPFNYELNAELEFEGGAWASPINTIPQATILVGGSYNSAAGFQQAAAMCSGTLIGNSSICGDGIVGANEVCELGQKGAENACSANGVQGTIAQICNSTCTGFVNDPTGVCTPYTCGNGVIEVGEQCDDGARNGEYGFCGQSCTYNVGDAAFCGDGMISPGEACDLGSANGTYNRNSANTCSWDCKGPAGFCGDGTIQPGETCDGNVETWSGALCNGGNRHGLPCTPGNQNECSGGVCGGQLAGYRACPVTRVCLSGDASKLGSACNVNADCNSTGQANGVCSTNALQTTRTRTCADDGSAGQLCTWNSNFVNVECKAELTCGNGVLDEGEQCDDGNTNNTDGCTNECKFNVCGDGFVRAGVEACDSGAQNGQLCTAGYQSTCSYCSASCQLVSTSGAFCGDGVINGGEYCDAGSTPYHFVSADGRIGRTCTPAEAGTFTNDTIGGQQITFTCVQVGMCNGGANNGQLCTGTSGLTLASCAQGGGVCEFAQCNNSCTSACPVGTSAQVAQMRTNLPGAPRENSIALRSFASTQGQPVQTEANAGTIYIPACRVSTSLVADIDYEFTRPHTYIVFVTDRSGSMSSWRLTTVKALLHESVDRIFDELKATASIGLVSFGTGATTDSTGCANSFCGTGEAATLHNAVDAYINSGSTYTKVGVEQARDLLNSRPAGTRKIMVLLTDGSPGSNQDPTSIMPAVKSAGIEVFTVAVSIDPLLISKVNGWSSGNPDAASGIDYAHTANNVQTLTNFWNQIVDAITGIRFSYIVGTNVIGGSVNRGVNRELPWPEGFRCDPTREQSIPIRLHFVGDGRVRISNVRFNMCAP